MTTIRLYADRDKALWDSYVLNHPGGTFSHLSGWKEVIEETFHHKSYYLVAQKNENTLDGLNHADKTSTIVGILPLFSVKSFLFCKSLVSVPFVAYGGILADDENVAQQLLNQAKEITRSERLEYLELRNRNGEMANLPTKDLYVGFRREIFKDLESNMKAILRKSRRMIRVGEKEGLTYQFGHEELLPAFYEIFARSYHHLGSPVFSKKLFENLLEEFKEKVNPSTPRPKGRDLLRVDPERRSYTPPLKTGLGAAEWANILLVKSKEGKPIASVLSFYYKDEVIPYYAGSLFEYRHLAPNDFMYWQLMKYGCENGYKTFDFGRSKVNTGSYDFKRHWGFEPKPLLYQYYLNGIKEIPNISPANPKYQKKIQIWQRLPFWATKLIGPRIVKYIP